MTDHSPPPPPPPSGPMPAPGSAVAAASPLGDIGELLTETTRAVVGRFGELFAFLVVITVPATAVAAPLVWRSVQDVALTRDDSSSAFTGVEGIGSGEGLLLGLAMAVTVISNLLIFAGVTDHFEANRNDEASTWRTMLRLGAARLPRAIGVTLMFLAIVVVANVVVIALGALSPVLAFVGSIALIYFLVMLWVRGGLALSLASLGRPGLSISASARLTRGKTWPLLGRFILLFSITVLVQLLGAILSAPLQWTSGAQPVSGSGSIQVTDIVGSNAASFYGAQVVSGLVAGLAVAIWATAMAAILRRLDPEA